MKEKILFLDTETGGIDPSKSSLLSIGLVVWCNNEILACRELLINDGRLKVSKEALSINKINIVDHKNNSIPSNLVLIEMMNFIKAHFDPSEKITLAGHNINFDINFLKYFFKKNKQDFNKIFSHRVVDTASILYFLYLGGELNSKICSSNEAFDYFKIKVENRHSALGDAIATANLFTNLLKLIKSSRNYEELEEKKAILHECRETFNKVHHLTRTIK